MDDDEFTNWLESYRDAWEEKDPVAAGELFAETAEYDLGPFLDVFEGRDAIEGYWEEVTASQNDPRVDVDSLAVDGDRGVGHFHAEFEDDEGATVEIDGVCIVVFEGERAVEFREWWDIEE